MHGAVVWMRLIIGGGTGTCKYQGVPQAGVLQAEVIREAAVQPVIQQYQLPPPLGLHPALPALPAAAAGAVGGGGGGTWPVWRAPHQQVCCVGVAMHLQREGRGVGRAW